MILITGGAGYIGSHCTLYFNKAGYDCVVFDNLSEGHKEAIQSKHFFQGCLSNIDDIRSVFKTYQIDAVIHFAAKCYVGESMTNPEKYYFDNVGNTLNLLKVMKENNVKNIVFSSTCATYGNPEYMPMDEQHNQNPINTYGTTKLMIEKILSDYDRAYGFKYIALRYFNAAGADESGIIGESHSPETHLIPLVLQTALNKRDCIKVFGNDYKTPDGTCIRDYIHVNDLAKAHKLALESLLNGASSDFYNLGTGNGVSVQEIINSCEKISQKIINKKFEEKRAGDPPILIASNKKAREKLKWTPIYTNIDDIIRTAWNWEKNRKY